MIWIIGIFVFVGLCFLLIYILNRNLLKTVTKLDRGTKTERDLVLKLLKSGIPSEMIFHDLYLKNFNGNYAQIDLVVVTNVGIIVIEVKNYKGWIFGNGYKPYWVQVLAYGKRKYRFYNPILQNNKHVQDLKKNLYYENIPFFSVIVFYGDCVLKNIDFVPKGAYLVKSNRILEVINTILKNNELAHYNRKTEVNRILSEAVKNGEDHEMQKNHINNIKDMLGKDRIFE